MVEKQYDSEELPLILDKTTNPWNVCHAPCDECKVKDGAEHTLEDCGLYP